MYFPILVLFPGFFMGLVLDQGFRRFPELVKNLLRTPEQISNLISNWDGGAGLSNSIKISILASPGHSSRATNS